MNNEFDNWDSPESGKPNPLALDDTGTNDDFPDLPGNGFDDVNATVLTKKDKPAKSSALALDDTETSDDFPDLPGNGFDDLDATVSVTRPRKKDKPAKSSALALDDTGPCGYSPELYVNDVGEASVRLVRLTPADFQSGGKEKPRAEKKERRAPASLSLSDEETFDPRPSRKERAKAQTEEEPETLRQMLEEASTIDDYVRTEAAIKRYGAFSGSKEMLKKCRGLLEDEYKEGLRLQKEERFKEAARIFRGGISYKDCEKRYEDCEVMVRMNSMGLRRKKKSPKPWIIIAAVLALIAAVAAGILLFGGSSDPEDPKPETPKATAPAAAFDSAALRQVGSIVVYGAYEQDNNADNGKERIEWEVLESDGSTALLISRYGLDKVCYDSSFRAYSWKDCSLRAWLNGEFIAQAFTAEETARLAACETDAGATDRVFLLSSSEAARFLGITSSDSTGAVNARGQITPTASAAAKGATAGWWLRSVGSNAMMAEVVGLNGAATELLVNAQNICVRPVIRINLSEN